MNETKLSELIEKAVVEIATAESGALAYIGDRLGLYRAMAGAGPMTSAELAASTETHERYVREWLNNQAAGGWVEYDAARDTYELGDEQAHLLADEDSPVFLGGLFDIAASMWADADRVARAFRTGEGVAWGEHDDRLYRGVQRFFGPVYRSRLASEWLPALDGVDARLRAGAKVADVGCGFGTSTVVMATAYPRSTFVGYDSHADSIAMARKAAAEAGVADRARFEVEEAASFEESGFDLVCFFDCLHDMGDPVGAAAHARQALSEGGAAMVVEPAAGDSVTENCNPVGRLYYAGSTIICTPSSLSQPGRLGLGGQAGPERLHGVLREAGFGKVRTAVDGPFNLVLEARS